MAVSLASVSSLGAAIGAQPVSRPGAERKADNAIVEIGKALKDQNSVAAQQAVNELKANVPSQNGTTDYSDALKALDQALKSKDLQGAAEAFANLQQAKRRQEGNAASNPLSVQPQIAGLTVEQRSDKASTFQANGISRASNDVNTAPRQGQETKQIQQAANDAEQKAGSERAFITRQDLESRAAETRPEPVEKGSRINVTA